MSSWYSSWFSGLPTFDFAVPSGIQRRFFSFLLRRTLGHFLKPGQLDLHQIDSQLGSGTVQVKDLELDGQAINQFLVGLPVSLYDGFISGVTARIPFPNPLSSSVGFHVDSLSLTFQVAPEQFISHPSSSLHHTSNLADSVISVAETFIHDELTPREGATLRHTIGPSMGPSPPFDATENLPGGFNPFEYNFRAEETHKEPHRDDDPAGVSVFATLIERLLAKFEFSAVDTKITLVYPGRASFTLSISEITYCTNSGTRSETNKGLQPETERNDHCGQVRTISISGLRVTSRDLCAITPSPTGASTLSPVSFTSSRSPSPPCIPLANQASRNSSSSSLDEDTQIMMSQSIAMLPPSSSHLSSTSGSMYQSAVSTAQARPAKVDIASVSLPVSQITSDIDDNGTTNPHLQISVPYQGLAEDVLLSFGSQPIVLSLQTPQHTRPSEQVQQDDAGHQANQEDFDFARGMPEQETLQLSVIVGTLACAFWSSQLRALLDIVDACVSKFPTRPLVSRKEASAIPRATLCLEANVAIRGIVIIALPEPLTGRVHSLDPFYARPLVPPRLPHPYLRLFLDSLSVPIRLSTPQPYPSTSTPRVPSLVPVNQSTHVQMVISDVSLFAFHTLSVDGSQVAAPILITDHLLPTLHVAHRHRPLFTSERPRDIKLSRFDIVDWTQAKPKSGSAKLSTWRLRNRAAPAKADKLRTPSQRSSPLHTSPNPFISSPLSETEDKNPVAPAIEVSGWLTPPFLSKEITRTIDMKIAPLHLFFDLSMMAEESLLRRLVDDVASAAIFQPKKVIDTVQSEIDCPQRLQELNEDDVDAERDIQIRRISVHAEEREEERKRLGALVLDDLNFGTSHQRKVTARPKSSRQEPALPKQKKTVPGEPKLSFCLKCPMIRVEVRCPPPPSHPPRSGCLLFDLRDLSISNHPLPPESTLKFTEDMNMSPQRSNDNVSCVILRVHLQEILAAYSLVGDHVAQPILTLGFLPNYDERSALWAAESTPNTQPLSIVLERPNTTNGSTGPSNKLSMAVGIPLINLVMDKAVFDGLQHWADDVAQLIERSFTAPKRATETLPSRDPSLIGSRYFTQLRHSGSRSTNESISEKSARNGTGEVVVKVGITEALFRFIIPRSGKSHQARPLDISALDAGIMIELKSQNREECVITARITGICIADTSSKGNYVHVVRSSAGSFLSAPRPLMRFRMTSFVVPETTAKESRIKVTLCGFTLHQPLDGDFGNDLAAFAKAPPGVFESVVPSECTWLTVGVADVSVHLHAPGYSGAAVMHFGEAEFSTELVGNSSESAFKLSVSSSHIFLVDSIEDALASTGTTQDSFGRGVDFWKNSGYALIAEISNSQITFRADKTVSPPNASVVMERIGLQIHLCADTISVLTRLINNMTRAQREDANVRPSNVDQRTPNTIIRDRGHDMTASLDEHAFRLIPEVGSMADMIYDDLPANQDYLDVSFGTAAGLRELRDDDLEDFDTEEQTGPNSPVVGQLGLVSNIGGETVRILKPFAFVEHHFDTISPDAARDPDSDTALRIRVHDSDIALFLHDGFDWPRTRKIIEKEVKEMRKKLARIRQLVATGQTQEPIDDAIGTTLFNSLHIGLEQDLENMDPDTLIAAIDDELDDSAETGSESSWQSLHPTSPGRPRAVSTRVHGKRLTRSKGPSIEIRLEGLNVEFDSYHPGETLASRTLILVRDLEILDHIKTSTWKKFLTDLRSDSRGNIRETESNMARVELLSVCPSPSHPTEEARLRAKFLPLRLYVDQDALDFFKKFFAFQDPDSLPEPEDGQKKEEIYFQHAEVFPVDIKLDYKPRRVDYKALRDGRTIELMNFFHFDGAEMTLRHLTLHGITGWPRFFDSLNDLWTPDVKATQLVDVISGVAPIRSVVNVGSGVADLVLLPIAQYKKDGRIVRGVQKGTKAFVQSTAMEAIKLGARLATGTQVILEQAENVLGGQFKDPITAEALQIPYENEGVEDSDEDLISRYAAQPTGLKEGVQSAYHSLRRNLHSAAQTILAVPMEVYERSGNEGTVRAVVRAVPIAVLKPMIGASEAVSKTLMGLHNTLDPSIRLENEAKYKHH